MRPRFVSLENEIEVKLGFPIPTAIRARVAEILHTEGESAPKDASTQQRNRYAVIISIPRKFYRDRRLLVTLHEVENIYLWIGRILRSKKLLRGSNLNHPHSLHLKRRKRKPPPSRNGAIFRSWLELFRELCWRTISE